MKLEEKESLMQKHEKGSLSHALMQQYGMPDETLNQHIYGNIPLKYVDFNSPNAYKMFEVKKPANKK